MINPRSSLRRLLPTARRQPRKANAGTTGEWLGNLRSATPREVWMVRVELAAVAPGVTVAGAKVAVEPAGRPDAVSVMALIEGSALRTEGYGEGGGAALRDRLGGGSGPEDEGRRSSGGA